MRRQKLFNKIKELFKNENIRQHFNLDKSSFVNANALNCTIEVRLQQSELNNKL
jgi:hypothetical protein